MTMKNSLIWEWFDRLKVATKTMMECMSGPPASRVKGRAELWKLLTRLRLGSLIWNWTGIIMVTRNHSRNRQGNRVLGERMRMRWWTKFRSMLIRSPVGPVWFWISRRSVFCKGSNIMGKDKVAPKISEDQRSDISIQIETVEAPTRS